jgi:hypothetical protein
MGFKKYIAEQLERHPIRSALVAGTIIGTTLAGATWEVFFVPATGYWNPAKQIEYLNSEAERTRKEQEEFNNKFNSLYSQFTELADRDDNGYIDFAEQVDAWKRRGQEGPFFESRGASQFANPTIEGLEKAIDSYKQE